MPEPEYFLNPASNGVIPVQGKCRHHPSIPGKLRMRATLYHSVMPHAWA